MKKLPLTKVEIYTLYFVTGLIIFGIVLSRTDAFWFEYTFAVEDGFIEWLTVLPLLMAMVITFRRVFRLYRSRNWLFITTLLSLAAFSFFAAGEELSWGQRMLHLESSEFFKENNSQQETNLHNLVIAGLSINLIVFSRLLILTAALYLLGLPIAYNRYTIVQRFVNEAGIPIARTYQSAGFLIVFALISLCPLGKRAELLEFGGCYLYLLIIKYPVNKEIYQTKPI